MEKSMKNTCTWKYGEFYPCGKFDPNITFDGSHISDSDPYIVCYGCDERLEKPEPKVMIKPSGETWVARYNGVDYMCTDVDMYSCEEDILNEYKGQHPDCMGDMWKTSWWSPISEIEITDEIAKLRPVVVWGWNRQNRDILCRVRPDGMFILEHGYWNEKFLLATVDDLP